MSGFFREYLDLVTIPQLAICVRRTVDTNCKDGVVLAAETRASAGLFIADRHVMKIQS